MLALRNSLGGEQMDVDDLGVINHECNVCGKKFRERQSYRQHMRSKSHLKRVQEKFLEEFRHFYIMNEDANSIQCKVCGCNFSWPNQFRNHLEKHVNLRRKGPLLKHLQTKYPERIVATNLVAFAGPESARGHFHSQNHRNMMVRNKKVLEQPNLPKEMGNPFSINQNGSGKILKKKDGHKTNSSGRAGLRHIGSIQSWNGSNSINSLGVEQMDVDTHECYVCGIKFTDLLSYRQHMRSTSHLKRVRQEKYLEEFRHFYIISEDANSVQCQVCGCSFTCPKLFRKHLEKHVSLWQKSTLLKHLQTNYPEMVVVSSLVNCHPKHVVTFCSTCHLAFTGPESARNHFQSQKHKNVIVRNKNVLGQPNLPKEMGNTFSIKENNSSRWAGLRHIESIRSLLFVKDNHEENEKSQMPTKMMTEDRGVLAEMQLREVVNVTDSSSGCRISSMWTSNTSLSTVKEEGSENDNEIDPSAAEDALIKQKLRLRHMDRKVVNVTVSSSGCRVSSMWTSNTSLSTVKEEGSENDNENDLSAMLPVRNSLGEEQMDVDDLDVITHDCYVCGRKFRELLSYQLHTRSKSHLKHVRQAKYLEEFRHLYIMNEDANSIQCNVCGCSFSCPNQFRNHFEKHVILWRKSTLLQHLQTNYPEMIVATSLVDCDPTHVITFCSACHLAFAGPESARRHFQSQKHRNMMVRNKKVLEQPNLPKEMGNPFSINQNRSGKILKKKDGHITNSSGGAGLRHIGSIRSWNGSNSIHPLGVEQMDVDTHECYICGKKLRDLLSYRQHKRSKSHLKRVQEKFLEEFHPFYIISVDANSVQCRVCGCSFTCPKRFRKHLEKHVRLWQKSTLLKHLQTKYPEMIVATSLVEGDTTHVTTFCSACHLAFAGLKSARGHFQSQKHRNMIMRNKKLFEQQNLSKEIGNTFSIKENNSSGWAGLRHIESIRSLLFVKDNHKENEKSQMPTKMMIEDRGVLAEMQLREVVNVTDSSSGGRIPSMWTSNSSLSTVKQEGNETDNEIELSAAENALLEQNVCLRLMNREVVNVTDSSSGSRISSMWTSNTSLSTVKEEGSENDNGNENDLSAAENALLRQMLRLRLMDTEYEVIVQRKDHSSPLYSAKSFEQLNIPKYLLRGIYAMGFNAPSQIQETSLPYLMANPPVNMIAQAQSGTGKTAAFLLASLSRVNVDEKYPQVLILSPTFELALQTGKVAEVMAQFCPDIKFRYAVKGNTLPRGETVDDHVVIGTPGRVFDWVRRYRYFDMKKIKVFVLDEADVMISTQGHHDQCIRIHSLVSQECQMLLFSATYTNEVMSFAEQIISNPIIIRLRREEETLDNVQQYYMTSPSDEEKYTVLQNIYGAISIGQTIIFCGLKRTAAWLGNKLTEDGHSVGYLSGDLNEAERRTAINSFREGKEKVLITTNVCARGIDIEQVTLVINFDLPVFANGNPDYETYLHRIGRTGRFGKSGIALNLVSNDRDRQILKNIENHFGRPIKPMNANNTDDLEKL